MDIRKKILVAGARGPIGWNVMKHLLTHRPDHAVVGCSRRLPSVPTTAQYLAVDLTDRGATFAAFAGLGDVTHLVYTAVLDKPSSAAMATEQANIDANLQMMRNAVEAIEAAGTPLEQLIFLQGTKAYGVLFGPIDAPARETDPMHMPPSLYHAQQDYVLSRQSDGVGWRWTIFRPQIVCGLCPGAPTNLISSIAVYCAVSRALGLPLRFPGPRYAGLVELVDARLLAAAIAWAIDTPAAAANQIFNVANGDQLDWNRLFARLAKHFAMELGTPQPIPLAKLMADKAPVWDRIARDQQLTLGYDDVQGNWPNLEFALRMGASLPPPLVSTIKLRQAGFAECRDSEDMVLDYVAEMQALGHLPR
jgi:nucleoside-diphosphate-sugar epimerase